MNAIKQLREDMGIDQAYLARKLSVSQPTISNWESGRKAPSNKSALKLANFFGVSVDFILGREATQKENAPVLDERIEKNVARILELVSQLPQEKVDFVIELMENMVK